MNEILEVELAENPKEVIKRIAAEANERRTAARIEHGDVNIKSALTSNKDSVKIKT